MELKVWVEGIQRVVCGVSDATTCQDVVIALAHATGKTGRFTLIERWRENERLVAPAECPLLLLRNWGEYAGDVHFLLRHNGNDKQQQQQRATAAAVAALPGHKRPLAAESNNASSIITQLQQQQPPSAQPPQKSTTAVKRNLTFSGAHQTPATAAALRPPGVRRVRKVAPFENSSLDSVEEQSSLSSQSSSSPYSSFQYGGVRDVAATAYAYSGSGGASKAQLPYSYYATSHQLQQQQQQPLPPPLQPRMQQSYPPPTAVPAAHRAQQPAAHEYPPTVHPSRTVSAAAVAGGVQATYTNSLERTRRWHRPTPNDRPRSQLINNDHNSTSHHNSSSNSSGNGPSVLASSLPLSATTPTHLLMTAEKLDRLSPRASPRAYVPNALRSPLAPAPLPPSRAAPPAPAKHFTQSPPATQQDATTLQFNSSRHNDVTANDTHPITTRSYSQQQQSQKQLENTEFYNLDAMDDVVNSKSVQQSNSPTTTTAVVETPSSLDSSLEIDENRNRVPRTLDYSSPAIPEVLQLGGTRGKKQVSRDDLLKLVSLQIEKLNSQESQMKALDTGT